jgi:uncharacterized protein with HEPN domain
MNACSAAKQSGGIGIALEVTGQGGRKKAALASRAPLDQMLSAAIDARRFVDGMSKEDFLSDKRTRQAVVMSLVIIGEAVARIMGPIS